MMALGEFGQIERPFFKLRPDKGIDIGHFGQELDDLKCGVRSGNRTDPENRRKEKNLNLIKTKLINLWLHPACSGM